MCGIPVKKKTDQNVPEVLCRSALQNRSRSSSNQEWAKQSFSKQLDVECVSTIFFLLKTQQIYEAAEKIHITANFFEFELCFTSFGSKNSSNNRFDSD